MQEQINRRGFLKGTVTIAGAAALAGMSFQRAEAIPLSTIEGKWDSDTDVLIVGAGGAGLVAAITAREAGAEVTVLEAGPAVGGTMKCTTSWDDFTNLKVHCTGERYGSSSTKGYSS